jgi:hypothetical protein
MSRAPASWRGLRLVHPAPPAAAPSVAEAPAPAPDPANDAGPIVFDSRPWRIIHGLVSALVVLAPILMLLAIAGWIG